MRKTIGLGMLIIIAALMMTALVSGASKARILQENMESDQRLERYHGLPLIISEKQYRVALYPETIMPESNTILYFNIIISNPTQSALAFSMNHLLASSRKKALKILGAEEIIAENRRFYSKEEYGISADQEKILAPFVAEKMDRLQEKLMKNQIIAAESSAAGLIAVHVPFGLDTLNIEVTTGNDRHRFTFNVGEF